MSPHNRPTPTPDQVVVHDLTLRLEEAQEALTAIRSGEVDALVVASGAGRRVYILRGADHAHRILLETLSEGALTIDEGATILYANRRFAELLGRPLEGVLGASLRALVTPSAAAAFDALLAAAAGGRSKGELTLVREDGGAVPAMISMSAVTEEGETTYTVVITDLGALKEAERALRRANDELEARVEARTAELSRANDALRAEIAERARLERELRRRSEELVEASQRKDEFLSMLSHELRNPLAPIVTATELMRSHAAAAPPIERYRAMIERQARTLTRLVDDLLDVSRITRRAITLKRQVIALSAAVYGAVEAARPLLDAGSHALRVALPAEPAWILVDPTRFEQVLVNLLNNAAKYTPRGGLVQVSAEQRGGEVKVRVKDNGVGIPAELLPHVFDLFVQGDRTLDRAQGGLGVGLALARSLVEMHGGRIEARSEGVGRGTELCLYLPVAVLAPLPEPPPDPASPAGEGPGPTTPRRRVVVVEDNPDAAEALLDLLRGWGHDARHASDGPAAIALTASFRPHVALIDVGLPGMNGYEVARAIRRGEGEQRPVIIGLSGYGQAEDKARGQEAGFDHHLVKPADPKSLIRLLDGQPAPPDRG
jgi:PAS domain S-box-containing protein